MWLCFRGEWKVNDGCDFTSVGSRKVKNGQDLASIGDLVPKQMWSCICRGSAYQQIQIMMTLLLQGVKSNWWLWLYFCRESKSKEWPRPCFCRGSSAKTNVILHLQRISISTNSNNGDFASAGSRENKWKLWLCFCRESEKQWMAKTLLPQRIKCQNKRDLASAGGQHIKTFGSGDNFLLDFVSEDHETIFKFMIFWMNACLNAWESMICFRFECTYECMVYFYMFDKFDFSTGEWMHDFMLMREILTRMRSFYFLMPKNVDFLFCSSLLNQVLYGIIELFELWIFILGETFINPNAWHKIINVIHSSIVMHVPEWVDEQRYGKEMLNFKWAMELPQAWGILFSYSLRVDHKCNRVAPVSFLFEKWEITVQRDSQFCWVR